MVLNYNIGDIKLIQWLSKDERRREGERWWVDVSSKSNILIFIDKKNI